MNPTKAQNAGLLGGKAEGSLNVNYANSAGSAGSVPGSGVIGSVNYANTAGYAPTNYHTHSEYALTGILMLRPVAAGIILLRFVYSVMAARMVMEDVVALLACQRGLIPAFVLSVGTIIENFKPPRISAGAVIILHIFLTRVIIHAKGDEIVKKIEINKDKIYSSAEIISILESDGWQLWTSEGSHYQFKL